MQYPRPLTLSLAFVFAPLSTAAPNSEPFLITDDGTVIDGLVTDQLIVVQANDVTLRNVSADRLWHQRPYTGLTVSNSEFLGQDPASHIGLIVQPDTLVENVTITGHKDGLYIETGGSVTVLDSFIDIRSDLPDNHSDGVTLPFAQNFNGDADFVFDGVTVLAEDKTAAFNQQGLPVTVVDSVWSGSVYAAEGSVYEGQALNPGDVRLYGRPVPWEIPQEAFDAAVDYDVLPLGTAADIGGDITVSEAIVGDFTGDGFVSVSDLSFVLNNWGERPAPAAVVTADRVIGAVDQDELNRLNLNWGASSVGSASVAPASLPEPAAGFALTLLSGLALRRCRSTG